ncbi:hypothetical protein H072_4061 [Dactylellina haptotyla CBS 200.50]|uniref:Uncharacterized protein n=1 Tax=Dactylellina haptotyla (strain CBS 200.50) TaxID=1284197 RepID=S8C2X3_DACHA|nr:hypothetical protein H072_4061 [Dactylellina haptotyla CBS 200.50]
MAKATFNPTSAGSQLFLLRLLKHIDLKTRKVNIEALAAEEGITNSSAVKKLHGIKAALIDKLGEMDGGNEQAISPPNKPLKKRKLAKIASPTKNKRVKQEVDEYSDEEEEENE